MRDYALSNRLADVLKSALQCFRDVCREKRRGEGVGHIPKGSEWNQISQQLPPKIEENGKLPSKQIRNDLQPGILFPVK